MHHLTATKQDAALAERADIKATGAQLALEAALEGAVRLEQVESALVHARRDEALLRGRADALLREADAQARVWMCGQGAGNAGRSWSIL